MTGLDLYGTALYAVSAFLFLFAGVKVLVPDRRAVLAYRTLEIFVVFVTIVIASDYVANRPFDMEGDIAVYVNFFNDLNSGLENPFETFEPGFIALVRFFGYLGLDCRNLFYLITFMFLWSYYLLSKAVFGRQSVWSLLVFGLLLFYPFFFSLTANIIRQGFSLCFINLALLFAAKGYRYRGGIFSIVATLFHKSSIVYFSFFLFRKRISHVSVYAALGLWGVVSVASYLKLFELLVVMLFDFLSGYGLVVNYSNVEKIDYVTGFRWDFWAFSSFAVFLLVAIKLLGQTHKKEVYVFYVSAFLACLHIAMFDVAYNDRFGIYSWIFYPLELGYLIRAIGANIATGKRLKDTKNQVIV